MGEYLETTERYHAKMRQWQKEKFIQEMRVARQQITSFLTSWGRTTGPAGTSAKPAKPKPSEVVQEISTSNLKREDDR